MTDGDWRTAARRRWRWFRAWRRCRPFWGGTLLLVGAVLTGYLPAAYDSFVVVAAGSFAGPALLFAAALALCGVIVVVYPPLSSLFGLLGMLLSTLALLGALGGFVVGSLASGLGGVLSYAWSPPPSVEQSLGGDREADPDRNPTSDPETGDSGTA